MRHPRETNRAAGPHKAESDSPTDVGAAPEMASPAIHPAAELHQEQLGRARDEVAAYARIVFEVWLERLRNRPAAEPPPAGASNATRLDFTKGDKP